MLNGGAIKGVVSHGQVTAWDLELNTASGKYEIDETLGQAAVTDTQGRFQLPVAGKTSGWVLIELTADGQTRMTCDVVPSCFTGTSNAVAFGETFALGSDFRLRAAVNLDASREVYLTPLSTLAVTLAEESSSGLSGTAIEQAYGDMEDAFGLTAGTLQLPPPDLVRLDGFSGSTDAIQLAVINAAFLALVDGDHWDSIEDVLADSEALIRSEGAFSSPSKSDGIPSVEKVMLEAAVLSAGLKTEVSKSSVLDSLDLVFTRTHGFYTDIAAGSGSGSNESDVIVSNTAKLSWNAPMTRVSGESIAMGELSGYKISYGRDPEALDEEVTIDEASTTSHTIENLSQGKWYFAVQAVDTEGLESPLSTVVTKSI
ncbi:hypothetical protein RE428_18390 [Marinobacter nanhaiticus D15-8W]|nr:hypothetical protein RE428_18390 [Marinobacter nanhaiticus D15-8W]